MSNDYILQFKKGSVNSKMYFNRHTLLTFLCAVILVVSSQKTNGSQLDKQVSSCWAKYHFVFNINLEIF